MGYIARFPDRVEIPVEIEKVGSMGQLVEALIALRFTLPDPEPTATHLEVHLNTLLEAQLLQLALMQLGIVVPYQITHEYVPDPVVEYEIPDISQLGIGFITLADEMRAIIDEEGSKISLVNVIQTLIRVGLMLNAHPNSKAKDHFDDKYKYLPYREVEIIRRVNSIKELEEEVGILRNFGKDSFTLVRKALDRIYSRA